MRPARLLSAVRALEDGEEPPELDDVRVEDTEVVRLVRHERRAVDDLLQRDDLCGTLFALIRRPTPYAFFVSKRAGERPIEVRIAETSANAAASSEF